MAVPAGTRLGPYEIVSAIGAGGMGEVYRARDTRLNRTVAIKVLLDHFADRSELRERFEREAQTIASLNHPHICTVYDVGREDSIDYLVMEYLEGETLAHRLAKGLLPLEQALQYAVQIADALDKAHRKGITHRDLKPGNIMLTKAGAKLLDFGLAKLRHETTAAPTISLSKLPTAGDPVTAEGTILGTLQYMAPEQLEGKEADARTDIFAFGVVIYEMVTGKKAFEGKSQASVIGAILKDDPPPISSFQPMTPPALDRIVKRCLAKDPDDRWQSARDICEQLRWLSESGPQPSTGATAGAPSRKNWRKTIAWAAAGTLACVIVGITVWMLKPASPAKQVSRTVIALSPGDQLAALDFPAVAISPDGTQIAYVATHAGTRQLFLRALDSLESRPLADTEGANTPFFSPDGQWLGFVTGGTLKKISVSGGTPVTLGTAPFPAGASWGSNGTIVFAPGTASVLEQISDAGGAQHALTHLDQGTIDHRWPEMLPGSEGVLFDVMVGGPTDQRIVMQSLSSGRPAVAGERRDLIPGGTVPHYATSGHLIYAQGGNLMAVPFDPGRPVIAGAAVPVAAGILQTGLNGGVQYALSDTGSLVYIPGGNLAEERLVWVNRNGTEQALPAPPRAYANPRISPDGRRVALQVAEQIWLYDFARDTMTRLTFDGNNVVPVWTPDGKRVAFQSDKEGPLNIFWQPTDGSGGIERIATDEYTKVPRSFSPDGQLLTFMEVSPTTGRDIWVLRMGDHKAQPFLRTQFNESVPAFSPDGHWLCYISDESGRVEVYVQPYPGPGGKYQVSTEGGTEPVWNPNGKELFYRSGDKMMAVEISTQPSFSAGKPKMLFQGPYLPTPLTFPSYDVSPDGQRFLMLKANERISSSSLTQIVVVQNWFEELKRRVPAGK